MRLLPLLLSLLIAAPAAGQLTSPPPSIPLANFTFERGLQAFQQGNYDEAMRRFREVLDEYPTNRSTTAAHLMAGKTLYAQGRADEAIRMLSEFIERFPTSRYLDEARYTLTQARAYQEAGQRGGDTQSQVTNLGILLPTDQESLGFTQSMFNGIRLAVEAHNRAHPARPIRMIFRSSGATQESARQAMDALLRSNVDVVIGPLYSDAAAVAGEMAERARVVMVAPMATEEEVTQGKRYVFQANPTFSMRGRLMARYTVERLRHRTLGVVAERTSFGERMATAFRDEARRLGADVPVFQLFNGPRGWYDIGQYVSVDALSRMTALYLPATGEAAPDQVTAALRRLAAMGTQVRALGNAEWEEIADVRTASTMRSVFTNEFYPEGTPATDQPFSRAYRDQFRRDPDRLAYAGYDVSTFLLQQLSRRAANEPLADALRRAPFFQGAGLRLHFDGGNINQGIYYLGYRDNRLVLIQ